MVFKFNVSYLYLFQQYSELCLSLLQIWGTGVCTVSDNLQQACCTTIAGKY